MTESGRCPVIHFDHNSQEHSADPVGSYRKLRNAEKRGWSEAHGGYWVLSDYDAVFDASRDDDTFSSARNEYGGEGLSVVIPKTPMHFHIPIELDPPEFRKYRKIVNPITSPAAVEKMKDLVEHHTTAFIDSVIEAGECDFTSVIGVPAIVTVDWLGLGIEDWKTYAAAHHEALAGVPGTPHYEHAMKVDFPYLSAKMRSVIADRRENPTDDVISYLVQQEVDGRVLDDFEVFAMVELLVAGGTGTTASLVSQTLVWLADHTDVRQRLIDDPSLMDHAVEEFLRFFSPTQALARTVTDDVEFKGCPMKKGDRVLLSWASANRDEELFENPDEIDIDRWPNRHTAFGIGVHRCSGSHLGRLMAKTLLTQILDRMPDYTIERDKLERYPHQGTNMGWQRIPAHFTPGKRILADGEALAAATAPAAPMY
ncbi:cytochrome P450 [Rhodococcoides fascians]|uniref:cytochrome P450 n=1 Tax=Rhodococcoides fascians TaxID=1828 RepID=UPI000369A194|nr:MULTISPECIES: cytochrome P450 [Rhodococcus]OZC48112.1 cytochrome P450 [Rhodococcus sp. 06-621-2]OZC79322.1 cytochrome P450 [Rhodococcus sp. 06-418-1B]OZE82117.1 cytochrome P450 [Rhodococcus sp. 15-649-1-2]